MMGSGGMLNDDHGLISVWGVGYQLCARINFVH